MSNDDKLILNYLAIINHLRADLKLLLITQILDSLRMDIQPVQPKNTDESWKELFGCWSDMDDDIHNTIRNARLPSREIPSFD
ncbi:MAG: hypothetical protein AAGK47_02095 [Bacteroidota bacterium]